PDPPDNACGGAGKAPYVGTSCGTVLVAPLPCCLPCHSVAWIAIGRFTVWPFVPPESTPCNAAAPTPSATTAGASTSSVRRTSTCGGVHAMRGFGSGSERTRSRRRSGAPGNARNSVRIASLVIGHSLLESLQGPVQARRARRRADPEQPSRGSG